ncbi:MAG: hypothetical protein AB7L92_06945 [Alphaproteobacteria bacterium]
MANAYLKFAENFRNLSPFDLNHLSETLLCKIEQNFEDKLCSCRSRRELTEKDLKFVVTETMRDILIELRQREISNEHLKLDETKAMIFAPRTVAA